MLHIDPLSEPHAPHTPSDDEAAEQFTAMAWTIMKLCTLHRTIKPELLTQPNTLMTAAAAELGGADTTPDNLYMIGTFGLDPDESLVLEFEPPDTRYWNITLENIWHECLEPRHRHSSVTDKGVGARSRRRRSYRHRRQGLRTRPLAGHRRPAPRIRGVSVARQPRSADGVGHGAQR